MSTSKPRFTLYAEPDVAQWLDSLSSNTISAALNSLIRAHIERLDSVTTSVQVSPPGGATSTSVITAEDNVSPGVSTEEEPPTNAAVAPPEQVSTPSVPTNEAELSQGLFDVVSELNNMFEVLKSEVATLKEKLDERSEELATARAEIKELTENFEEDHYTLIEIQELLQELPALEAFRELEFSDVVSTVQEFPLVQQLVVELVEQVKQIPPSQCEGGGLTPFDN